VRFDRLYFLDDLSDIAPCHLQIVVVLQIKPKMRRRTERLAQAESRVRCDTHILRCDALNARSRNAHLAGERASRQLERNKKFLTKNFTGVQGREFFGIGISRVFVALVTFIVLSDSRLFQLLSGSRVQVKQTRTLSLTLIEYCPARSPFRASRRLPGGAFKSSNRVAAFRYRSFRRATFRISAENPLGHSPLKTASVIEPLKLLIMRLCITT
jgi:hypothetical protein